MYLVTEKTICIFGDSISLGASSIWKMEVGLLNYDVILKLTIMNIAVYNQGVSGDNADDLLELSDLDDGLHPNPKGHKKIFLKIKEFLLTNKIVQ